MSNPYVRCTDSKFDGGTPPHLATGAVYRKVKEFNKAGSGELIYEVTCHDRVNDVQTSGYSHRFAPWEPQPGDQIRCGGARSPICDVLEVDTTMFPNGKVGLRVHNQSTGVEDWIAVDPKDYGTSVRPILGHVPKPKGRIDPNQTLGDALHKSSAEKEKKEAARPAPAAPTVRDDTFDDLTDADRRMVHDRVQRFHALRAREIPEAEKNLAALKAELKKLTDSLGVRA